MIYREEVRDLFSVPNDYYLAHCISDDYALGAGIAKEFNKKFEMRYKLLATKKYNPIFSNTNGHCIIVDKIINLVTKEKYWHKPTYKTLTNALVDMKEKCLEDDNINGIGEVGQIKKIAMPLIGCGLDRLQWNKVSEIIKDVFKDTEIEILVCKQ